MIRHLTIGVILITACGGCASSVGMESARHRITTPFTALAVEGSYKTKQDVITTNEDLELTIDQIPDHPNPEDPNSWEHHFRVYFHVGASKPATITVHNTKPAAEIEGGWIYLDGDHPVGQTQKGVGVGEGTKFVIRADVGSDLFVNTSTVAKHAVQVTNRVSSLQKKLPPGTFCIVKDDGSITDPAPNSSSAEVKAFLIEVQHVLEKAGF